MKWNTVRLKDIAKLEWGNTSITKASYVKEGFPAFSAAGNDGFLNHAEFFEDGIVLSAIGARCGKCFKAHGKWTAIKNTITIIPNVSEVDLNFLFIQLNDEKSWKISGAAQPFITLSTVRDRLISLPPLAEQQRIAALLDTADRILKLRESAIVKLDELEKSVFVEMFGDALAGTGKYKSLSFESITTRITYGFTSPMRHLESGIPILTAKNIKNGYIDLDNIHFADRKQFDDLSEKSKPRKGDVLITKDGTIGRTALVDSDETYCINQSVALVQLKNDLVTPQYTVGYLTADSTQRAMKNMSKGNALKHLQITELAKFPIPLPPMDYQNKYSSFVKEIKLKKQKINKSLVIANALIASLQHQAFTTGFNA